jgi:hypothetical protein
MIKVLEVIRMRFQSVNELEKFDFKDSQLTEIKVDEEAMTMVLEAVIVKHNNSANEMMVDSYAGTMQLRLTHPQISDMFLEGYKYYDANDVLKKEVPDRPVASEDYPDMYKKWVNGFLFAMERQDDGSYMIGIDVEEDTYWTTLRFEKAIAEWERYMNKVQQ